MAEPAKKPKTKSSRSKQTSSSNAPRLKVVIRRLPPNLPEAIFWQSVAQWITDETITWKLYVQGKLRTKLNRENTPSRAYVEFKTPEAVVIFNRDYNGHLFRDKQGNESFAVVEYAPFQKVPHEKRKVDARMGTVEADEDFISFLNALNKPAEPTPDVNELVAQAISAAEPASTPLLDALKAAKESSTIKGYHSHYRDQANPPRSRAQLLEDEQTYSRKAPLLPKSQPDPGHAPSPPEPPAKEEGTGKGKEKEKEREGGGKKGKNKQKPTAGSSNQPKPQQQPKSTPQPPPSPSTPRATAADPSRARPVVGLNARGGLLAAIGAATETRTPSGSRKASGRQREVSGSAANPEASAPPVPTTPLPAGVLAIPASSIATPESGPAPPKSRRGKGRSRGGGAGGGGPSGAGGEGARAAPAPAEMPRIDDPGQALPSAPPAQRGRGRGRGGRGRGRGRGGAAGGGEQPSAPTG